MRDLGTDRVDPAVGTHPACMEHDDAIGQCLGFFQVMRGQQDADAIGDQTADRTPHLLPRRDIEAGGGLVEEQQLRPSAQRERELHAALLPAREPAVAPVEQAVEPGQRHAIGHAARLRIPAARQRQQFAHLQALGQLRLLQHHADLASRLQVGRRAAEQRGLAGVGGLQAQQDLDGGGLAGAVDPQQRGHPRRRQREIHAIECLYGAAATTHALQARERRGRGVGTGCGRVHVGFSWWLPVSSGTDGPGSRGCQSVRVTVVR